MSPLPVPHWATPRHFLWTSLHSEGRGAGGAPSPTVQHFRRVLLIRKKSLHCPVFKGTHARLQVPKEGVWKGLWTLGYWGFLPCSGGARRAGLCAGSLGPARLHAGHPLCPWKSGACPLDDGDVPIPGPSAGLRPAGAGSVLSVCSLGGKGVTRPYARSGAFCRGSRSRFPAWTQIRAPPRSDASLPACPVLPGLRGPRPVRKAARAGGGASGRAAAVHTWPRCPRRPGCVSLLLSLAFPAGPPPGFSDPIWGGPRPPGDRLGVPGRPGRGTCFVSPLPVCSETLRDTGRLLSVSCHPPFGPRHPGGQRSHCTLTLPRYSVSSVRGSLGGFTRVTSLS